MKRARTKIVVVAVLFIAPFVFLSLVGGYHLWANDWGFIAWWPMAGCMLGAYGLAWYWTRRRRTPKDAAASSADMPGYWTERDRGAWKEVERFAAEATPPTKEQMADLNRYAQDAQALAMIVTGVYRPGSVDPFGHLTVPEILACGELIAHDLSRLVDMYVPGSHSLTVNNFRSVSTAADWYERGRNVYWGVSLLFDPLRAGLQILATKAGLQTTFQKVQQNVLAWFYTTYLQELGRYLIELNSGRLKVGTRRYLELMQAHLEPPAPAGAGADDVASARQALSRVVVAAVGPVKAGKSSLVNAMLGERRAVVSPVPQTATITRYDLDEEGLPGFTFLDTVGFGLQGPTEADVKSAVEAASKADILLLTVPARSAARQPEVDFLARVRTEFAARPELRLPPIVVVLTHIDLLTPAMEWAPPYDWKDGTRPKERSIREALEAAAEVFTSARIVSLVPVCTTVGQETGVRDDLLAVITTILGEARGVALLRTLHAEASQDKTMKVIGQAVNVGREIWKAFRGGASKPG